MNPSDTYDRLTDRTLAAEKAVLGAVIVDPSRFDDAAEVVGPDDFFRRAHAILWRGMAILAGDGKAIDPITLSGVLSPADMAEAGGPAYVAALTDGVPRASNVAHYARQVRDAATRRRLEQIARQTLGAAQSGDGTAAEVLEQAEAALAAIRTTQPGTTLDAPDARASAVMQAIEAACSGKQPGLASGLSELDAMTSGFRPGQLVVLGARPAMGKSALALTLAIAAGRVGPVLFASLEMSSAEINARELAARSGVPHEAIDAGRLGEDDMQRLGAAMQDMADGRVHVLDKAGATLSHIRGAARRLAATSKATPALIVVDYLQLMRSEPGQRVENRTQEVASFSMGLKRLAREIGAPVLALSQLSRESERRTDKRPLLADLRESGSLEQDADIVILLHRPGVYEHAPDDDRAELILAKQRNGPTGIARASFRGDIMRFEDARGVFAKA